MKQKKIILFVFLLTAFLLNAEVYFKGSDKELHVIRLVGEKKGKVVLVFGGIHGDEPGGYFSSELLQHINMKKGSLIIVPRVNLPGIMMNRREVYGDMNRKFSDKLSPKDPDAKTMEVLKRLMGEADIFINQHDAFGFHREKKERSNYGPKYYGQCLIIDTDKIYSNRFHSMVLLESIAKKVVKNVNKRIKNPMHHFVSWNHHSIKKDTDYPAMKKSATHYAITRYSIPAFGLETSKNLPDLETKVHHQLIVIQEILTAFGLEYEMPSLIVKHPKLNAVQLIKNDKEYILVNNDTNIRLKKGEKIKIDKIFANYSSGLSADIIGWGQINDLSKDYIFKQKNQRIILKKNNFKIGKIYFKSYGKNSLKNISLIRNGKEILLSNWAKIILTNKDKIKVNKTKMITSCLFKNIKGKFVDILNSKITYSFMKDNFEVIYSTKDEEVYLGKLYFNKKLVGGFSISFKIF